MQSLLKNYSNTITSNLLVIVQDFNIVTSMQHFIPPTDLTLPAHLSTHLRKISDVDGVKNTTCPFSYA